MLNEGTTHGVEDQTSARLFSTKWIIVGAVFHGLLLPICQEYFGDGWTILGAVVGAALGCLGVVLSWKAGGHAKQWLFHAGWSKPLSRKWALVEGVFVAVSFGLVCELIWHKMLVGLALGIFFAPIFVVVRLVREQYRHAAPKPTPWMFYVLAAVGLIIGLILGGVFGGLTGMWLRGFQGTMLGAALGAMIHAPKWAFWGGVIGLAFYGLLVSVSFVIEWFSGHVVGDGLSWENHAFAAVLSTFVFAMLAAVLKMPLPGRTSNNKDEPATTTEGGQGHGC